MTEHILQQLAKPFHPSRITFKPGALTQKKDKALAMAYADLRAYQDRLDEVCGMGWSVSYTPWGDRVICHVTIDGITRSSTGESGADAERNEIAGTAAEAQAFKRACAMFGLGRYLYTMPSTWVDYDAERKRFTERGLARLNGIIANHYQRYLDNQPADLSEDEPTEPDTESIQRLDALGLDLYGEQWPTVKAHNVKRLTGDETAALTAVEVGKLISGLAKLKQQRQKV